MADILGRPQQGTGYTNIQRLMAANKGNQLGSTVAGGIGQQATQAKTGLEQSQQQFSTASAAEKSQQQKDQEKAGNIVNTALPGTYQDTQNKAKAAENTTTQGAPTGVEGVQAPKQTLNQYTPGTTTTGYDASQPLVSDEDTTFFKSLGNYSGPQGLQNTAQIQAQAQQAQQLGQLGTSAGGRQALLQRFIGRPGYTQGQQGLDTALLGKSGNQQLLQAKQQTQGLVGQEQSAEQLAAQQAQGLAGARSTMQQGMSGLVEEGQKGLGSQLQKLASTESATRATQAASMKGIQDKIAAAGGDVSKLMGNLSPQELDTLGIDTNKYMAGAIDANALGGYINQANMGNTDVTALQEMTPEDKARYQALSQLGAKGNPLKISDSTQVGGKSDFDLFNQKQFQTDADAKQAELDRQLGQLSGLAGQFGNVSGVDTGSGQYQAMSRALQEGRTADVGYIPGVGYVDTKNMTPQQQEAMKAANLQNVNLGGQAQQGINTVYSGYLSRLKESGMDDKTAASMAAQLASEGALSRTLNDKSNMVIAKPGEDNRLTLNNDSDFLKYLQSTDPTGSGDSVGNFFSSGGGGKVYGNAGLHNAPPNIAQLYGNSAKDIGSAAGNALVGTTAAALSPYGFAGGAIVGAGDIASSIGNAASSIGSVLSPGTGQGGNYDTYTALSDAVRQQQLNNILGTQKGKFARLSSLMKPSGT